MNRIKEIGIKRKVLYGCIVLGVVLFFSGMISIFEYSRMNDYVSELIGDNIKSINTARELLSVSEQYNVKLMNDLVLDNASDTIDTNLVFADDEVISSFAKVSRRFITDEERSAADSVIYAYSAYMQVAREADEVWKKGYAQREDWYFNRLQPVYLKFRGYMMNLTSVCQDALINNSQRLQEGFYRSIMPPFISMIIGIVMVILLNYYLNYYVINPILKINKGIKGARTLGSKYSVRIDSDDEIMELNETVRDMVDLNQSYKKKLNG
ncbi:MAG: MCP four helix bundle domain-containing protein [Bacteroidales bacterium]|nr:MCP four helix bundle domain-containing protein [Candidatus Cacconaster merdequi]